jgi:hypothetical protein
MRCNVTPIAVPSAGAELPTHLAALGPALNDLLSFKQIEADPAAAIPVATCYAWARENRHGFGDLVIKIGRNSRIRRLDLLLWIESRKATKGGV